MAIRRFYLALLFSLVLRAGPSAAHDIDRVAGDILEIGVPAAALITAYEHDDAKGEAEWLRNTAASVLLTQALKFSFNQSSWGERPDHGGKGSFPSGHTALTASGAAFLSDRYGWEYGTPAWLLTGYVAYNRVEEHKHHWRDVIAGAALSYGISKLFVTPLGATHLGATIGPDWLGLRIERSW